MNVEKKREFIINIIYLMIIGAIIYIAIKYALGWFLPFVIGFGIAFMLKPLINLITKKLRINRKVVAGLTVLIFYATVGALLTLIIVKVFIALKDLFIRLPNVYMNNIEPLFYEIAINVEEVLGRLDPSLVQGIRDMIASLAESLGTIVTGISTGVVSFISSTVSMVPSFFVIVIFTIIASFFFAMDYVNITGFIAKQFSPKVSSIFFDVKDYIVGTLFKFVKAYSMIITITFIELSIGLSILRVDNAISVALLIACVDVLPVLGTGGIVIPWIFIELFKGNVGLAIGLTIVYVVITVVRNILEPKIVGQQVGLHPLIMLICIFVGVRLFGFLGIFTLPIMVIILKNLNDSGKIKIFK
ncbi:sporulation integral membrane protein YtvI [Clostridium sp. AL.422]|uniref:sporulation integral membrane protein YtvI n=1 Tax=Clostridium TaxID=1485 RepID=UPI00293DF1DF|nr:MULTISPECIES: sporulation integral membrane protein YtvI [unclassified Clostridium]MDV4149339.1 sporulation integral membrane protein YtvI [Clostridium sp. AL.422]